MEIILLQDLRSISHIIIQIHWELNFIAIPFLGIRSQQIFAYACSNHNV